MDPALPSLLFFSPFVMRTAGAVRADSTADEATRFSARSTRELCFARPAGLVPAVPRRALACLPGRNEMACRATEAFELRLQPDGVVLAGREEVRQNQFSQLAYSMGLSASELLQRLELEVELRCVRTWAVFCQRQST